MPDMNELEDLEASNADDIIGGMARPNVHVDQVDLDPGDLDTGGSAGSAVTHEGFAAAGSAEQTARQAGSNAVRWVKHGPDRPSS